MAGAIADRDVQNHAPSRKRCVVNRHKEESVSLIDQAISENQAHPEFVVELRRMNPLVAQAEEHFFQLLPQLKLSGCELAAVSESGRCIVGDIFDDVEMLAVQEFSSQQFVIREIASDNN